MVTTCVHGGVAPHQICSRMNPRAAALMCENRLNLQPNELVITPVIARPDGKSVWRGAQVSM